MLNHSVVGGAIVYGDLIKFVELGFVYQALFERWEVLLEGLCGLWDG